MFIERLSFDTPESNYHPLETAIHTARYQIAKDFVKGKRVLDIACGEGYGSYLLKEWGASSVLGVDIAEDAIGAASKHFLREGVEFICGNAENIQLSKTFDLIVSFETIEHVENQNLFLTQLKNLLAENGHIIISCPNDHFYYNEDESNPYHLRKYTFDDFTAASEIILGKASTWLIGGNIFGYGNFIYHPENNNIMHHKPSLKPNDINNLTEISVSECYNLGEFLPDQKNCTYYVGIWGPTNFTLTDSASVFSIKPLNEYINTIEKDVFNLKSFLNELENVRLKLKTTEEDFIRSQNLANESIDQFKQQILTIMATNSEQQALIEQYKLKSDLLAEQINTCNNEIKSLELANTTYKEQLHDLNNKIISIRFITKKLINLLYSRFRGF